MSVITVCNSVIFIFSKKRILDKLKEGKEELETQDRAQQTEDKKEEQKEETTQTQEVCSVTHSA